MRGFLLLALTACGRLHFDSLGDGGPVDTSRPNVAFISSLRYAATFGSVAGADKLCQQHADQVGLEGTFIALLDPWNPLPLDRLAGSRGWVDPTGVAIVDLPAGWFDTTMFHPIRRNERAELLDLPELWSGAADCVGWTSSSISDAGGLMFTGEFFSSFTTPCSVPLALLCLEIGHAVQVVPETVQGRLAFASKNPWSPSGIQSADAQCTSEAATVPLPGTYIAVLATSTSAAFARFSNTGPPWTRIDGIPLAATAADMVDTNQPFDSFLTLAADGTTISPIGRNNWVGDAGVNCNDWVSSAAGQSGRVAVVEQVARAAWAMGGLPPISCSDTMAGLFCMQQ